MFDTRKFGAFLSKIRKNADMTQAELADRLNISRQAVSKYENGDSFPDVSNLLTISRMFGVSLDELINSGDPTEGEANMLDAAANGRDTPSEQKHISDVISLAPYIKPSALEKLLDSIPPEELDISGVAALAEYLNDGSIIKLLRSASYHDVNDELLDRLMPYLDPAKKSIVLENILKCAQCSDMHTVMNSFMKLYSNLSGDGSKDCMPALFTVATLIFGMASSSDTGSEATFSVLTEDELPHIVELKGAYNPKGDVTVNGRFFDFTSYMIYRFDFAPGDDTASLSMPLGNGYRISVSTNYDENIKKGDFTVVREPSLDRENQWSIEDGFMDLSSFLPLCRNNTIYVKVSNVNPDDGNGAFLFVNAYNNADCKIVFRSGRGGTASANEGDAKMPDSFGGVIALSAIAGAAVMVSMKKKDKLTGAASSPQK